MGQIVMSFVRRQLVISQLVAAAFGMIACSSEDSGSSTASQGTTQPTSTATSTGVGTSTGPYEMVVTGPFSNSVACREKEALKMDPQCRRADEPAVRQANN